MEVCEQMLVAEDDMTPPALKRAVEQATGESLDVLRSRSIDETRRVAEKRRGKRFVFTSKFPFIGRGNVMRDKVITREEVDAYLDDALRD